MSDSFDFLVLETKGYNPKTDKPALMLIHSVVEVAPRGDDQVVVVLGEPMSSEWLAAMKRLVTGVKSVVRVVEHGRCAFVTGQTFGFEIVKKVGDLLESIRPDPSMPTSEYAACMRVWLAARENAFDIAKPKD